MTKAVAQRQRQRTETADSGCKQQLRTTRMTAALWIMAASVEGAARRMQRLRRKKRRRMQRRRWAEAAVVAAGSKPELCIETSAIY